MTGGDRFVTTDRDRAVLARQAEALAAEESDDEGTAEWREGMRRAENERRRAEGLPALKMWWEDKTEPELYHRARALGLLGRDR